jgi:hypothetical protein
MQNDQTQYGPIKGNTPSGPFESLTISIVVRMEMQDKTANGTTGDNIQYSCSQVALSLSTCPHDILPVARNGQPGPYLI